MDTTPRGSGRLGWRVLARLVVTCPHDAQLDYVRLTQVKALHTDAIPEQLHSVSRFRINSVQCSSRSFDEAHHRTASEFGWWRRVCPGRFWLNRDVVPDHARTIMLSHRMGENSVSAPVLLRLRIVYPPESYGGEIYVRPRPLTRRRKLEYLFQPSFTSSLWYCPLVE